MTHVVTESCINCLYTDCVDVCPVDCFHKREDSSQQQGKDKNKQNQSDQNGDQTGQDQDQNEDQANFLVIDPDECIDCAVCVAECPVNAIYAEEDVPLEQQDFIALNAKLARQWPTITRSQAPLRDADDWKDIKNKRHLLKR